jgi:hypothetical protein
MNRATEALKKRHGNSSIEEQVHWKCPDCLVGCRCVGLARSMRHERCGGQIKTQDQIDEGMRQAYADWLRQHAVPGGHA